MLGSCECAQVRDWNVPKLVCTSTSTSTGPQQQLSTAAASLIIVALCLGPATSHQPPATHQQFPCWLVPVEPGH